MIITRTAFVSLKSIINISSSLAPAARVLILPAVVPARGVPVSRLSCLWIQVVEKGHLAFQACCSRESGTVAKIQTMSYSTSAGGHRCVMDETQLWRLCIAKWKISGPFDQTKIEHTRKQAMLLDSLYYETYQTSKFLNILHFKHYCVTLIRHSSHNGGYNGRGKGQVGGGGQERAGRGGGTTNYFNLASQADT